MGAMSRAKGRTAEREVELALQAAGFQCDRNLGGRTQVSGDIAVHQPPLAIEVRRRETLQIVKWSREHEASTPDTHVPVLVYRPSREPWRASLRLDDFCSLIASDEPLPVALREAA